MNSPQRFFQVRRGNLFLLMLVGITILAAGVSQMIPNYVTVKQRQVEQDLRFTVGQIRAGFDLERRCGAYSPCAAEYASLTIDPASRTYLLNYLATLQRNNFLPSPHPRNPAVSPIQWGTGTGQLFWEVQQNLLASLSSEGIASFEASGSMNGDVWEPIGWKNGLIPSTNASATFYPDTPSAQGTRWDDYQGQNKMGMIGAPGGYSLRIATGTP